MADPADPSEKPAGPSEKMLMSSSKGRVVRIRVNTRAVRTMQDCADS